MTERGAIVEFIRAKERAAGLLQEGYSRYADLSLGDADGDAHKLYEKHADEWSIRWTVFGDLADQIEAGGHLRNGGAV
jgi:hypothetical protein